LQDIIERDKKNNITNGYEENGANDIYIFKIIAHEFSQKKKYDRTSMKDRRTTSYVTKSFCITKPF
jgi:hypothetical protein